MTLYKDISVVVQGTVDPTQTPTCLASVRRCLPGSTLILSTWQGSNVDGLEYDELVLSKDPGGIKSKDLEEKTFYNNTNRMILGVQEGLKKVRTPYTLKLRSDIILHDADFLNYWDKFSVRDSQYSLFQHRVLNYYLFTPQFGNYYGRKFPSLFHPSDWMFFGLTEDIQFLYSIPLQPDPEYSLWWTIHQKPPHQVNCWPASQWRYSPEQYLFYSAVKKRFPTISFEHYLDVTRKKEDFSRRMMINNFVILDYRQWHISMSKYQEDMGKIPYGQTSHAQWQEDYKNYCDPSFYVSWQQRLFKYYHLIKPKKIEWEKRLTRKLFSRVYKWYIYKKYAKYPIKLKQKLAAFEPSDNYYIYVEDRPRYMK
ncbi:MAG: hypothetical protein IKN49_04365 [Elusimicrobiaceae bacterium]|nr:hypothetical protein [Elusimicrobiaceae bacterium]